MKAIVYRQVMDDIVIDVTPEEAARGVAHMECGACNGTGRFIAHPLYPEVDLGCAECSTRGRVAVSV